MGTGGISGKALLQGNTLSAGCGSANLGLEAEKRFITDFSNKARKRVIISCEWFEK
jgi:hypothetical protein